MKLTRWEKLLLLNLLGHHITKGNNANDDKLRDKVNKLMNKIKECETESR